ncbi:guanylate-binding protein 6-like [Montipora foliosa]|uniref:guanylate-binding protein 6-like n=1 Tax=Montipora foliosa TaxID=591990 RepID=UPI0035F12BEB
MDSSRRQAYQLEDDDEALAKALELCLVENDEQKQSPKYVPKGPSKDFQHSVGGTAYGGIKASQTGGKIATPLCLPNNCRWDSRSQQYVTTAERRTSLYVVQEAIEQLKKIKGPVCVVSIAGPYRMGKSYALSEAFDQPEVFPLGHTMEAETMGIWLWVVPEKFKDSRGQEFTVVLLDSEGIDSATGEGVDDNQIFTLTVLLASVLIYNSQSVPKRSDLKELEFIVKLSQRIEVRSKKGNMVGQAHGDSEFFHQTFPFFIWLLRDVMLKIPRDYKNPKDYFLKEVFKCEDSPAATEQGQKVAESIIRFFPGFEAFMLPPPTLDPEKLKTINDNKSEMNPKFFSGIEEFKQLLRSIVVPKKSFNDGELVTGESLAVLVELYVEAINCPGAIPNVQDTWDIIVEKKSVDTIKAALENYENEMASRLQDKLPCDNDELRNGHQVALETSQRYFMDEIAGFSTKTTEQYLNELKKLLGEKLNAWQTENGRSTKESCNQLLVQLKGKHVDPILLQLRGKEGAKLSFQDIIGGCNRIKEDYDRLAVGAKDVIAAVFFEFNIELMKEQEQHLGLLRQLKDFDEDLTRAIAATAYQEQEKQKLEEERERLLQDNQAIKNEMKMLGRKQQEEMKKLREQTDRELQDQKKQMNNMNQANMEQARREREEVVKQIQDLRNQDLARQKANKENLKMIEKLSGLVEKQEAEKRRLQEQAAKEREEQRMREMETRLKAERQKAKLSGLVEKQEAEKRRLQEQAAKEREEQRLREMEIRHKEEQEKLRREMEAKMKAQGQVWAEKDRARVKEMEEIQEKYRILEDKLKELEKPGFFKRMWAKIKNIFP